MNGKSAEWPHQGSDSDMYPFVAEQGLLQIRVDMGDGFGALINSVLERTKDPRRYVIAIYEDAIRGEGLYTLAEAQEMARRLDFGSGGDLTDPMDSRSEAIKVYSAIESLKPKMIEKELKQLEKLDKEFPHVKKEYAASMS